MAFFTNNIWQSEFVQNGLPNGNGVNGSTKVQCPECQKDFVHPRNLQQHQRSVHKQIRYYCTECDHSYTRQYNLTHHRLKAHPEMMPPAEIKFLKKRPFGTYHPSPSSQLTQTANHIKNRILYSNTNHHGTQLHRRKPANVQRIPPELDLSQVQQPMDTSASFLNGSANSVKSTNSMGKTPSQIALGKPPLAHVVAKEGKPLQLSRRVSEGEKGHACLLCPFFTENTEGLKAHVFKHSIRNKLQGAQLEQCCKFCNYCPQGFAGLVQHGTVHFQKSEQSGLEEFSAHVQKEFLVCMYCERKFGSHSEVETHEKLHQAQ